MLHRLYVDNYKCLVNFDLPLRELSLLLGPNGAGKTSVLDIVFALRRLLGEGARITDTDVFPTRTLTRWQHRNLQVFEIRVVLDDGQFVYRLEVEHERSTRRARIHLERLTGNGGLLFEFSQGEVRLFRDNHSEGPRYGSDWSESALARVAPRPDNTRLTRFMDFMRSVMVCGLHPAGFRTESTTEGPLLHRDGHNFADWYRHMLQERPDLVPGFTNKLREVLGDLNAIRLEKVGQDTRALMVVFDEDSKRYELRFDEISDGQRAIIVLYGLIHLAEGQGYTLFLDEPDNYVALPEIQPWLLELADACGEKVPQAVICSHHPELIDYLGGDNGLLLQRERSGVVTTHSLENREIEGGLKLSELIARGWNG